MKALVTGGAGFIGSHVVDLLLKEGHQVIVLDNLITGRKENLSNHPNLTFHFADVSKREISTYFKDVDWVFHLASLTDLVASIHEPEKYYDVNVSGTFNVLEASRKNNVKRFIYAASASCYGTALELPTPETAKLDSQFPYALTKRLGEELVLHYDSVYKIPAISLRLFNVYGPRCSLNSSYGNVFSIFLKQKKNQQPLSIIGDGGQTRDFIFVEDVAMAFYKAAICNLSNEVYNVGTGQEHTIKSLAAMFSDKFLYVPKRKGETERSVADTSKIQKQLKWTPTTDFASGVSKFIKFYS